MRSHISLFAGIGGLDLAAEAAGFTTVATAEADPFCRRVLEARFPNAEHYTDVRDVVYTGGPRPLLISGGFPCQDVSAAGLGAGLDGERSGLWGEFDRIIGEFQPQYVLIENVAALRNRGLDRVVRDLLRHGYSARWDCIPAASVGAPHVRDRLFLLASRDWRLTPASGRHPAIPQDATRLPRAGYRDTYGIFVELPPSPNPRDPRHLPTPTRADGTGGPGTTPKREGGKNLRTVAKDREGNGRLNPEFLEWMMGLPLGWTNPEDDNPRLHQGWESAAGVPMTSPPRERMRGDRVRALGNSVVPQAAREAFSWLWTN